MEKSFNTKKMIVNAILIAIGVVLHAQEKTVEMDFIPDYITKIVGNLISNAIKFTPFNGQVSISTKTKNNRFVLTVQDNGCGISTKDLPYIFDAFYAYAVWFIRTSILAFLETSKNDLNLSDLTKEDKQGQ